MLLACRVAFVTNLTIFLMNNNNNNPWLTIIQLWIILHLKLYPKKNILIHLKPFWKKNNIQNYQSHEASIFEVQIHERLHIAQALSIYFNRRTGFICTETRNGLYLSCLDINIVIHLTIFESNSMARWLAFSMGKTNLNLINSVISFSVSFGAICTIDGPKRITIFVSQISYATKCSTRVYAPESLLNCITMMDIGYLVLRLKYSVKRFLRRNHLNVAFYNGSAPRQH